MPNGQLPSVPSDGFTLALVTLRVEQDLVSLSRRTRAAGEEFGLDARDVRRLASATYEVGRVLCAQGGCSAVELGIGDGPSLQVTFRLADADATGGAAFDSVIASVRRLVHRVSVTSAGGQQAVGLAILFPSGDGSRVRRPSDISPAAQPDVTDDSAGPDLSEEIAAVRQSYAELLSELQETNRGVVALYAELDDKAERLRVAEDRLRLLLDSVHDYAICMLSPEGHVASWNAGAQRLFGYSADEIIDRDFAAFYPAAERDLEVPRAELRYAEEQGRMECEGLRIRLGGGAFDAHVLLTPVRGGARDLRGFSLVVRDITERKRLEDDLRRRAEDLAAANRAKEDFLATLSHELRTPLNAMLGWTRLLRTGKLDASAKARALETIERNARIQEQLIADILDVSRIVTGKLRLELRPIELAPVVDEALDAIRPAAEAKGIQLQADTADFSGAVLGDPDRLQQVIWNLLANAIKFTPPGGAVRVTLSTENASAVITVLDTGEGIDADLLPFIFDRFRQGDASVTRPHGGLGLGLSIVRHIIELHGGSVHVRSEGPGTGTTFSVHLPVRAVQSVNPSAIAAS